MMEDTSPVKDCLFSYIKKSENHIKQLIREERSAEAINGMIAGCYDDIIKMGGKAEALAILATGILHYLLTSALVTSQRKVEMNGTEIDIVVPDLKTLQKDPKRALLICIPKTLDKNTIEEKLKRLHAVQPVKENVWLVLSDDIAFENKTFVISKTESSFSQIIFGIAEFTRVNGKDKFKILRI